MDTRTLESVAKATVRIPCKGGQGVVVGSGLILTAAHCLEYDADTGICIASGEMPIVEIEAADGTKLKVTPWVIESVSDVAILGPLDNQAFGEDVEALEEFILRTRSLPIFQGALSAQRLPVLIRTHKGGWIPGEAAQYGPTSHRVALIAREPIESGTSGGPVVTVDGKLVGIVSQSTESDGECHGSTPRPHLALPVWAAKLIKSRRFDGY